MRVFSIHPMTTDVNSFLNYLHLDENLDLVWDAESPEILFASEWIYYQKEYFEQFKALYEVAKIRVMLAFEAISPDWNLFDYAVGFDNHLQNEDRFIRLMSPIVLYNKFISSRCNEIDTIDKAKEVLARKKGFCNFLYSNPDAHPMRDQLFYALSQYKHVDSLGRHLNNVEKAGTGFEGHAMECVSLKNPYKFSIASENAVYNGYTSEKVYTSLEAHTVPIYFGNPDIIEDVNPDAIINVNDFDSLDSLVAYVKEVDMNDELWCKYVSAPWLTPEQETYHTQRTDEYMKRMMWLLTGDVKGKERIAVGTHPSHYRKHFFDGTYHEGNVTKKSYKFYIKSILRWLKLMK